MKTLTAVMPNGETITRTTRTDYKYVVVALDERGWGWLRWSTRKDLAEKAKKIYEASHWRFDQVEVIPVES